MSERFRATFRGASGRNCHLIREMRIRGHDDRHRADDRRLARRRQVPGARLLINCTHGTVIRLLPALNITAEQIDEGAAATSAARIRPSSRLRRSSSPASRLWLSARRASSSSPLTTIGALRSPVETRSTAAAIARNGAVRSAARAKATSTASRAAMAMLRSRTRGTASVGLGSSFCAATTTKPNEASGRTAAAMSAMVSRVRKPIPRVERLGGGRRARRRVEHGVGSDLRGRPEPAGRDRLAGRGAGLGRPRQRAGRRRSIRAGWPVGHAQVLVPASGWLPSRESGSSMATSR